jgi:hypothetical protein
MDIDVLVPPVLLSEAAQLLQRLGYTTDEEVPVQSGLHDRLRRHAYHHCLLRSPANVALELHWRLGTCSDTQTQRLVAESLVSTTTGLNTLLPATELAYLVAHGTGHYWTRLKWLSDIKQALLCLGPATWGEFASECAAAGVQHSVEVTRHMLAAIFATPSAALPHSTAQPQARHARSARYALYRMQAPLQLKHGIRSAFDRTRYRLDCSPTHERFAAVLRCAGQMRTLA